MSYLHYDTVQWKFRHHVWLCLVFPMTNLSSNSLTHYFYIFTHFFFFNSIQCALKKSPVCYKKCLFWACSFLMRTLSVLIEAQTRLSIKIHRRNFHVSTDPQWVQIIFGLEYQIFIRCFLDLLKSGMYFLN